MANPLTGNYDAVVQVAFRQINGLVAALHQHGLDEDAELKLLHSLRLRVPPRPRRQPLADALADWVLAYQRAGTPRGYPGLRDTLVAHAPAGAARSLTAAFDGLEVLPPPDDPPDAARGMVALQVSTLRLSIPDGAASQVAITAHVRAHFTPAPESDALPAPVHGDVRAVFTIEPQVFLGRRRLVVKPSANDSDITFTPAPGSGLTGADASRLSHEVRRIVRDGVNLLPVDVPQEFPFSEFKGVGSGSTSAIALPLSLSGAGLPAGAIGSITSSFLGSSGFGFAVSREHVIGLIDVQAIRQAVEQQTIPIRIWTPFGSFTVTTYRLRLVQGPTLTFQSGAIEISGRIDVTHPTYPDGWVTFRQRVTLQLDQATQRVTLEALGDPDVDDSWIVPHGPAFNAVRREMNRAIVNNRAAIRRVFDDARNGLARAVKIADAVADVHYSAIDITPDGIVARGDIVGSGRQAPVLAIGEAQQGQAFTALDSWIPGGDIRRFLWSWLAFTSPYAWSGELHVHADEHRFLLPKPAGLTSTSQLCLRVEGVQIVPSGLEVPVAGGQLCQVPRPDAILDMPAWFGPVMVPIWQPDVSAEAVMQDGLSAHVSMLSDRPLDGATGVNTLVIFTDAGDEGARALFQVKEALNRARPRSAQLAVIIVVPAGTFMQRRRDIDARMPAFDERRPLVLHLTEDHEQGWSKAFAPEGAFAMYLIDARRAVVWSSNGVPEPETLARALDVHVTPAPAPRAVPLALSVPTGGRAPDAMFRADHGEVMALHRLRRRTSMLGFWQSWSAPCLAELARWQRHYAESRGQVAMIAFHGGNDDAAIDRVRKELGLTFTLVQDREQRVARRFGVVCWPTTVWLDEGGRVGQVQFGRPHERTRP